MKAVLEAVGYQAHAQPGREEPAGVLNSRVQIDRPTGGIRCARPLRARRSRDTK
jgi:hypothetical protein